MNDVLGYRGKHVVVTGGASGMGEAATAILLDAGAAVTVLDIKPTSRTRYVELDLRDRAAIEATAAAIEEPVDVLLHCAGLPGPPFSDLDVAVVNFVGARHLSEQLVPKMSPGSAIGAISSSGAIGWQMEMVVLGELLATHGFDAAVKWLEQNPDKWSLGGYRISKMAMNAWAATWCTDLADLGIRINCVNPGPSDTPMMPQFKAYAGDEMLEAMLGPIHRLSTPEEQAWPLVMLSSPRMSYVTGEILWVDGGFQAALTTGRKTFALKTGA